MLPRRGYRQTTSIRVQYSISDDDLLYTHAKQSVDLRISEKRTSDRSKIARNRFPCIVQMTQKRSTCMFATGAVVDSSSRYDGGFLSFSASSYSLITDLRSIAGRSSQPNTNHVFKFTLLHEDKPLLCLNLFYILRSPQFYFTGTTHI